MVDEERSDSDTAGGGKSAGRDAVAGSVSADETDLVTLLGHFYRGQLDRETTWRTRLDRTTNWAVLVIATLLTWTFSGADNPHYILLLGVLLVVVFLGLEAHRYRAYDVPRSRVRMLEEDLFARLFDPEQTPEQHDWRQVMSEDLRRPASEVTGRVAVSRRLRRVYLPLLSILLGAWTVKITVFQPGQNWVDAAALPPVSGEFVIGAVAAFYVGAWALAVWPQPETRREVEGARPRALGRDDER